MTVEGQIVDIHAEGSGRWVVTVATAAMGTYVIRAGTVSGPYVPGLGDTVVLSACRP